MAQQTSVEWLVEKINRQSFNNVTIDIHKETIEQAKAMHKEDCINFAEQWQERCNEKNMDSKEQLYDEIYKK